jgi:uncharacterized protein YkwD
LTGRTVLRGLVSVLPIVVIATLVSPAGAGAGCPNSSRSPAVASKAQLRAAVGCLVNRRRAAHGLAALRGNRKLRRAAEGHSTSMVRHDYFSHSSRGGGSFVGRIRRTGYLSGADWWSVGEVIAIGRGRRGSPRGIVRSWMQSPGHRALLLSSRFRQMGVGAVHGYPGAGSRGATYTIDLGVTGG